MRFLLSILAIALLCSGCGDSLPSVKGSITINGNPVPRGSISLMPTDGGPTVGSPIDQGTYAISELEAGKYQVIIAGYDSTQFAESSADLEAAAKSGGARTQSFRDLAQGAEGNNIEVEILAGSQVLDFPLKSR